MERLEALTALRDAVRCGEFPADKTGAEMGFDGIQAQRLYNVFSGSLDEALALHEAVVPGWDYCIDNLQRSNPLVYVQDDGGPIYNGEAKNPACAWFLAILEAKIGQEQAGNAANPAPTSANRAGN